MRDELVGYAIDALEPHEKAALEAQLARDPGLQRDLEIVRRSLLLVECDRQHFDPPTGLAQRTCQFVALQANTTIGAAGAADKSLANGRSSGRRGDISGGLAPFFSGHLPQPLRLTASRLPKQSPPDQPGAGGV